MLKFFFFSFLEERMLKFGVTFLRTIVKVLVWINPDSELIQRQDKVPMNSARYEETKLGVTFLRKILDHFYKKNLSLTSM